MGSFIKKIIAQVWQLFPNIIRRKIDIIRRSFLWRKHKTIFIHVPKAAGVSVNLAVYGKPLGHFYAKDIKAICPNTFNNVYKFSVVRHPIDRLYSAYTFSQKGGTQVMRMHKPSYYINHSDFKTFDRFVCNWLNRKELNRIDHVFRPQYLYLFDDRENLLVDKFYKLEEIENHYHEISQKIGKPFSLGNHNISEKEPLCISEDLKDLIFKLYQKDFELLGYTR